MGNTDKLGASVGAMMDETIELLQAIRELRTCVKVDLSTETFQRRWDHIQVCLDVIKMQHDVAFNQAAEVFYGVGA